MVRRQLDEAEPFASVPVPMVRAAARRVVTAWSQQGDDAEVAQVLDLLTLLTTAVCVPEADGQRPIDPRAGSALGRLLLDMLRAEVVRAWSEKVSRYGEALATLTAIERVREAMGRDGGRYFTSQLSGPDGLELLVAIVHDLRSPLTAILFLAEEVQRGRSGPVNELQRRHLGLIYGAALGLSSAASDIVELARGGDQLAEKRRVPFSVTTVLQSVRDIVEPMAEQRRTAIRLLPPEHDSRLGHPVPLSRVLLNLTTNALKFSDRGSVEIETEERGPDRVEFAVRDHGKGMSPTIVRTLYQPLRRAAGRIGHTFSRTGLGLTMCRALVAAMGSELKVEARRGWGTRFFFTLGLPRCPRPPAVQPARAPRAAVSRRR